MYIKDFSFLWFAFRIVALKHGRHLYDVEIETTNRILRPPRSSRFKRRPIIITLIFEPSYLFICYRKILFLSNKKKKEGE